MPEITIAHISDTHLGYRAFFRNDSSGRNLRTLDIEHAYEKVVNDVLTEGHLDLIVHTGDVFHQSRPSWSAMRAFIQQTRRLEALGVPMIVIAGNHDTAQLRQSSTVFSVLELALPQVTFVTGYEERRIPLESLNVTVTAVPHGRLMAGSLGEIEPLSGTRNLLLTHGLAPTLAESPRHELGEMILDAALLSPAYDAILLGHFHKHERVATNTWYAGATERIGWNDAPNQPGWSLVTLADTGKVNATPRLITARPMVRLDAHDGTSQTAAEVAAGVLDTASRFAGPDSMVRIELLNVDRAERRAAESIIRRESAGKYLTLQTYSREDNTALFNEDVKLDESLRMKGISEMFSEFCAAQDYDPGFRERFLVRGREAIEAASRAMEAVGGDQE
jgi:DNA repair exonuclease SbcCD nuclease subunit